MSNQFAARKKLTEEIIDALSAHELQLTAKETMNVRIQGHEVVKMMAKGLGFSVSHMVSNLKLNEMRAHDLVGFCNNV